MTLQEVLADWYSLLRDRVDLKLLSLQVGKAYSAHKIYPSSDRVFRIFKELNPSSCRVILTGLDPYHNGQASGIAFGVETKPIPASLRIIKSEMETSVYNTDAINFDYTLESWVKQGVFLYNTALTVVEGEPNSHSKIWEPFTKAVFEVLADYSGLIYVLWGNEAKKLEKYINPKFNHILTAAHPASESYRKNAGFYGCNHFNLINDIIKEQNGEEFKIKW